MRAARWLGAPAARCARVDDVVYGSTPQFNDDERHARHEIRFP